MSRFSVGDVVLGYKDDDELLHDIGALESQL